MMIYTQSQKKYTTESCFLLANGAHRWLIFCMLFSIQQYSWWTMTVSKTPFNIRGGSVQMRKSPRQPCTTFLLAKIYGLVWSYLPASNMANPNKAIWETDILATFLPPKAVSATYPGAPSYGGVRTQGGDSKRKPTGGPVVFLGGKILNQRNFLGVIQMPSIF